MASSSSSSSSSPGYAIPNQNPQLSCASQSYFQNLTAHLYPLTLQLDYNNFSFWISQVLSTVRAHGLEGFLLRSVPRPAQLLEIPNPNGSAPIQSPKPEFLLWMRHDQCLLNWLFALISEFMLGHVSLCSHAFNV